MPLYKTYNKSIKALTLETPPGCMGECPCFEMRVEASGALEYRGLRNMPKIGEHKGRINSFDYLASVVETSGFLNLSQPPEPSEWGLSTVGIVSIGVELVDGQTFCFWRDALDVPPLFWAVETLMMKVLEDAEWGADVHDRPPREEDEPRWAILKDIDFDRRELPYSAKKVYLKAHALRPPEPRENNTWIAYRFSETSYIEFSRSVREYTLFSDGTSRMFLDFAALVDQLSTADPQATDNK